MNPVEKPADNMIPTADARRLATRYGAYARLLSAGAPIADLKPAAARLASIQMRTGIFILEQRSLLTIQKEETDV